ncbi:hypothetical protein PIB30_024946 [Stylosanthes scabra]|uniref:Uncharacterized protein n=1 Tax=Stylosanthes scabra TaxID=79078 RepID=A0ABU6VBE1_9FABA|nr:hypothetical protein [Stylosanthes scabra]
MAIHNFIRRHFETDTEFKQYEHASILYVEGDSHVGENVSQTLTVRSSTEMDRPEPVIAIFDDDYEGDEEADNEPSFSIGLGLYSTGTSSLKVAPGFSYDVIDTPTNSSSCMTSGSYPRSPGPSPSYSS